MSNIWIINPNLFNKFEMAQEIQLNYNFLNVTITYFEDYLLNK